MKKSLLFKLLRSPLLFLTLLSSCSTGYHSKSLFGTGYSEFKTNPSSFTVTYRANSFTNPEKVQMYALMRASELSLKNGFRYFKVESAEDLTNTQNVTKYESQDDGLFSTYGWNNKSQGYFNKKSSSEKTSKTISYPAISLKIKCVNEIQANNMQDYVDANYFLKNNKK